MRRSLPYVAEMLRQQIWLVPAVAALLAAVAALLSALVEERADLALWRGSLDAVSARAILGAVSSAMISFTALVFSVTMLVLQLVSSQLSPRVMRTFLRDRFNQGVLGLFVATFVFSLLTLVMTREDFVPGLGVIGSIGLVLVAVMAFVAYIDHMANAIRASNLLRSIGEETRVGIERLYPDEELEGSADDAGGPRPTSDGLIIRSTAQAGYVVVIDEEALVRRAAKDDLVIELLIGIGDPIAQGGRLLAIHGTFAGQTDKLIEAVQIGGERTMSEDPIFGFRQIVDIALRALSPGVNDPTTAIQAIDQVHNLLRQLLPRSIQAPRRFEVEGTLRVLVPSPGWEAYVDLAVTEIRDSGRSMPQVIERLRAMLEDLASDASAARLPALRRALVALDEATTGAD
jgi:uncharacterized membrane protein